MAGEVAERAAPGESVTLSSQSLPSGSPVGRAISLREASDVYAYVDSHNPGVSAGAVAERNEYQPNRAELHGLRCDLRLTGAHRRANAERRVGTAGVDRCWGWFGEGRRPLQASALTKNGE